MVVRVNGAANQGVWVEQDVRFLQITADLSDWIEQTGPVAVTGVLGGTQQVLDVIGTRCTVLGVTYGSADDLWVMCGYANAFTAGNTELTTGSVEAEIAAEINLLTAPINYANATVDTFAGFSGITPDTTP